MVSIEFETLLDRTKEGKVSDGLASAIHSGNGGDLLYGLPAVRALGVRHLYLNVYRSADPLRQMNEEMAMGLVPLLIEQDYIDRVTVVRAGVPLETIDERRIAVDYILDRFRLEDFSNIHLMQAHAKAVHASIDPNAPFLTVPDDPGTGRPDLVLSVTSRYRALTDEYLRELTLYFKKIIILALPHEWRAVGGIDGEVRKCKDILEMATIIGRGRLFLGNPSLASAVAEGLKVPRVIDLPESLPNAFPIGPRGFVIPRRRAEFLDIVNRLCGDNIKITPLYRDLAASVSRLSLENAMLRNRVRALDASLEKGSIGPSELSLVEQADDLRPILSGAVEQRIDRERTGVFLHPGHNGVTRCTFFDIELAGYDSFHSEIALEHPQAPAVDFSIRIVDEQGSLVAQDSRRLTGAGRIAWSVPFAFCSGKGSVELTTSLADTNKADFAWAWFYRPLLGVA